MKKHVVLKSFISVLAAVFIMILLPSPAFAEEGNAPAGTEEQSLAKRTILLYDCGSDLETDAGLASYNLRQVLKANFSADDDVRFIVMTGGADKWHMKPEELVFPEDVYVPHDAIATVDRYTPLDPTNPDHYSADPKSQISNTYNQIWEAKGADALLENGRPDPNAGKLVLLDGDGVLGDGENARRSIPDIDGYVEEDGDWNIDMSKQGNYEWMIDPEVLRAFINYGADHYPAERYDLILWDHGAGIDGGFCSDLHDPSHGLSTMEVPDILDALSHNKVVDADGDGTPDGKFDFVDFDACVMASVEVTLLLSDLTDVYIASPENEPGYGQDYEGWLNLAGEDPEIDAYELSKKIVDDFIRFYDSESSDGASQDGTLAAIDMKNLMTKKVGSGSGAMGFQDALSDLFQLMQNEVVQENLYYDEFRSFRDSLSYGAGNYYDLGNLASQISYLYQEADHDDLKDGNINDRNAYSDTAEVLMNFLEDPDVIYAKSTKGIRTKEQYYRNAAGDMQTGTQGTSGLYLCFKPLDTPNGLFTHYMYTKKLFGYLDPKDSRRKLLEDLNMTMTEYGLVYHTGTAVTDMVSTGTDKKTINYKAVKKYWRTHTDQWGSKLWKETVKPYLDAVDGGEKQAKVWLKNIIKRQKNEGILKDQIQVETFGTEAGTGCEITMNDVKKQAISSVSMNLIAELPAVEEFLKDPAHQGYLKEEYSEDMSKDFSLGTIRGKEIIDFDPAAQGYEKAIDWLLEPTSKWKLDPPADKWYVLQDAEGRTHVTAPIIEENELDIPVGYFTTELRETYDWETHESVSEPMEVCHVIYLIFKKDSNGNFDLTDLYIRQENGGWRCVPVSEYKGAPLSVVSLIEAADDWSSCFLPAGRSSFTLSGDTISQMQVKYVDIKDITDIADTDGDSRNMHSTITINNIYGQKMDITDLVNEAGRTDRVSIKDAEVVLSKAAFKYNGKVHKPTIKKIGDGKLKAGVDYSFVIINSKGKTVASPKAAGTYTIRITGKGDYAGTTEASFEISKAANPLKIKPKTAVVKYSKLKKKARTLKAVKVIRFINKGQGERSYGLVAASRNGKSCLKSFKVSEKTGKVTVSKGLKKGTYKVKVKVRAAGNINYKASAEKTVTSRIKVR